MGKVCVEGGGLLYLLGEVTYSSLSLTSSQLESEIPDLLLEGASGLGETHRGGNSTVEAVTAKFK